MTFSCEIIRDLLPLYIDGVCSEKSKDAVKTHLSECDGCRKCFEKMSFANDFSKVKINDLEDSKMAESLKKVKSEINGRIKKVIIGAVLIALFLTGGFYVLFEAPVKSVDKQDVEISADIYPLSELVWEKDGDGIVCVKIPNLGQIGISKESIDKNDCATVISLSSKYALRDIKEDDRGDTLYIYGFKTTLLNNRAKEYQKTVSTVALKEIKKIVFVEKDGQKTVLFGK